MEVEVLDNFVPGSIIIGEAKAAEACKVGAALIDVDVATVGNSRVGPTLGLRVGRRRALPYTCTLSKIFLILLLGYVYRGCKYMDIRYFFHMHMANCRSR